MSESPDLLTHGGMILLIKLTLHSNLHSVYILLYVLLDVIFYEKYTVHYIYFHIRSVGHTVSIQ